MYGFNGFHGLVRIFLRLCSEAKQNKKIRTNP
jgi:hypothetical protein